MIISTIRSLRKPFCLAFTVMAAALTTANAQDLEETMAKLTGGAGKLYVAPIVSGFGSNLNGGWFHRAPPPKKFSLTIEGGLMFMGTFLDGANTTFEVQDQFSFDSAQSEYLVRNAPANVRAELQDSLAAGKFNVIMRGPTLMGSSSDSVKVIFQGKTFATSQGNITVPGDTATQGVTGYGDDLAGIPFPLFAPQVTLGTVYGTNVTVRYLPSVPLGDVGEFSFMGFGIQHNPQVWMDKKWPVDVSVSFSTQSLEFGSVFEATTMAYGLNASKTLGWRILNLTPYAGISMEQSSFTFTYDQIVSPRQGPPIVQHITFDSEGENSFRGTVGLSIRLLFMNLNADYNIAKYSSFTAGIMFGI